jgi:flavoprotein
MDERPVIRRLALTIPVFLALSPAVPAANASVMAEGVCDCLVAHAAALSWGTGKVSVAVFNHIGDGR